MCLLSGEVTNERTYLLICISSQGIKGVHKIVYWMVLVNQMCTFWLYNHECRHYMIQQMMMLPLRSVSLTSFPSSSHSQTHKENTKFVVINKIPLIIPAHIYIPFLLLSVHLQCSLHVDGTVDYYYYYLIIIILE